jgi:putative nucleotidyltransferase with HDIG domain
MGERILIVDDETAVRGVVASVLERGGYRPVTAGGAAEATELLHQSSDYAAVLCDIMMPEVDGLTLLDQIGADYPGLPVVMCTAVHDIHVATNAFRRGAFDYLLKPFERNELNRIVERAVEHGRIRRQSNTYRKSLEEMVGTRTDRLRETMQELERSYDVTLEAMGDALDLRDAETEGHCRRVTAYTTALSRAFGLPEEDIRIIARGAFLHDIGKIATPDRILLKPGKLDSDELEIMREHCTLGYGIVRKIPFLSDAAEIVHAHQERFDGTGYPRGLRGTEIPIGARIFAIADALDAITSDRPYRRGSTFTEATAEIARCAGKQFDPEIVKVFLSIPETLWAELRTDASHEGESASRLWRS